MKNNNAVREHLLYLLKGDGAHLDFDSAVKDLPVELRGARPQGAAHSPWELLEHLRIAQLDVLDSIRDAKHISPEFPVGYWPQSQVPANETAWEKSAEAFRADFEALVKLINNDSTDLLGPIPHVEGQTIFRKIAMLADHNAYHLGQLVVLRRMLGTWQMAA
ncbi:MAG TPA: DinB family protein [Candidatus Sulfotelmatobacter sp.]|nr:DinB family protein [Candidatus Sulfotelmatobacter sp.]